MSKKCPKNCFLVTIGVGGALVAALTYKAVQARCKAARDFDDRGFPAMADYPDLRHHNNLMAKHLTPRLYSKLAIKSPPVDLHWTRLFKLVLITLAILSSLPWEPSQGTKSRTKLSRIFLIRLSKSVTMASRKPTCTKPTWTLPRSVAGNLTIATYCPRACARDDRFAGSAYLLTVRARSEGK